AILSDTGLESCIFTKYASRFTSSLFRNVVYSLKASALIGQVVLSLKRRTGLSSDAFQTSFKSATSVTSFVSAIFIYLFLIVQILFYIFLCFSLITFFTPSLSTSFLKLKSDFLLSTVLHKKFQSSIHLPKFNSI